MKKLIATFLIATACALPSLAYAQDTIDATSNIVRARLNPVINVDASGHARLDRAPGTANDHFTAEMEIAKDDFDLVDITPGNGFADEVVELHIMRAGAEIYVIRMPFKQNRPSDVVFEVEFEGAPAPEIRAGDIGRVIVNGHPTLRGKFHL